jgi:hypothetical protein
MPTQVTPAQLDRNIKELAAIGDDLLNAMGVAFLRKRLGMCRINAVERDGELIPLKSARKSELIEAIHKLTQKDKVIHTLMPDLKPEDLEAIIKEADNQDELLERDLGALAEELFLQLRAYTQSRWNAQTQTWKAPDNTPSDIGFRLTNYLSNARVVATTALRYRSHVVGQIRCWIGYYSGNWYSDALDEDFERFLQSVKIQMKSLADVKQQLDSEQLANRKFAKAIVDISDLLRWAHKTLSDLTDETPKTHWLDVSVALGLVTGRRSSETHATAFFEVVGDHRAVFTGQLKNKGRTAEFYSENPSYEIPTLVDASLVVKGLEWLTNKGKRADDPEIAHKRYSKELNRHCKVLDQTHIKTVEGKHCPLKYHGLRQLYALCCIKSFKPRTQDEIQYIGGILGHGRAEDQTNRDISTPQRYMADYILSDDCLTSI